ncbi:MAG: DUF4921 family protein [Patescibacteria group bacterium]|jgi:UDPglucose--hexose-1-phosphate uridylyltransferase
MKKKADLPFLSSLRQDFISGDWVVVATGRAARPDEFKRKQKKELRPVLPCRFCQITEYEEPILAYREGELIKKPSYNGWTTVVVANRYPAFLPRLKLEKRKAGPYRVMNGKGFHELVITADHNRDIGQMEIKKVKELIDVYQSRYLTLCRQPDVSYVAIFHNQGEEAGASIAHHHSQIMAIPVLDAGMVRDFKNTQDYWQIHKKCPHCLAIAYEKKTKKRLVFENKDFIAFVPFAPRVAFEIRIYPKKHRPYFEKISAGEKWSLAEVFKVSLGALEKGLNSPDYNFFLKTAPCREKKSDFYHFSWHILPKTQIWAGFELGAQIEISTIAPEEAAAYLRRHVKLNY